MALTDERLSEVVTELVKPGTGKHERVRVNLNTLLTEGLGLSPADVQFERNVPIREVRGRIDALLGRTIFELKSDLRTELVAAQRQLMDYITEREQETGQRYIGIATDGAVFRVYERRSEQLVEVSSFTPSSDEPHSLLDWLASAVVASDNVAPEPELVRLDLGQGSVAYGRARRDLEEMWASVSHSPEVVLKRQLWAQQLERVYGSSVESNDLWFQHTYLTIVAKTMATAIVNIPVPGAEDLLSGHAFEQAAIFGAVESDFFDWVLEAPGSRDFISRVARQACRFRLHDAKVDVLKGLYESLIDPAQRHELGEYYTPDWLAARVCERAITDPLNQRVLDPACGSGTFLFQAVKRFLEAADAAGWDQRRTVQDCTQKVFGIDVHPVAAIIARVTYLLALGPRLQGDRGRISIPVYLGDSLQWNTTRYYIEGEVLIGLEGNDMLHFPAAVAQEPGTFDEVVNGMLLHSEQGAAPEAFGAWLEREHGSTGTDADTLVKTYTTLKRLYDEDRDHIWGYVARNLSRPVWLASTGQRAHVLVGNPPWLSYRFMSRTMQERFKKECQERGIWAGGKVATHQDLSALFFAKSAELYLQAGGVIAFVMPYAALNRKQFEGFRTGWYGVGRFKARQPKQVSELRFVEAWSLGHEVQPLFPVPSCVLFAENRSATTTGGLPATVTAFRGRLPRRDASAVEAAASLTISTEPLPQAPTLEGGSVYREAFRQGATIVPRMLSIVERVPTGPLGGDPSAPAVRSARSRQEKPPWQSLPPLQGTIERQFVRPLMLGESIAPYRLLGASLAVIPWVDGVGMVDAAAAQRHGFPRLSAWLRQAEGLWEMHKSANTRLAFGEQLDYFGKLSAQFPVSAVRVLYAASGTQPAACVLTDKEAVIEHKLYWTATVNPTEARFLTAVINSETVRSRIESMQSQGQWGARDFDKVMFELPIPKFDPSVRLHMDLAALAARAEALAEVVDVSGVKFVQARAAIRQALCDDGVAAEIDRLVAELVDG